MRRVCRGLAPLRYPTRGSLRSVRNAGEEWDHWDAACEARSDHNPLLTCHLVAKLICHPVPKSTRCISWSRQSSLVRAMSFAWSAKSLANWTLARPHTRSRFKVKARAANATANAANADAKCLVFSFHNYENNTLKKALPDATFSSARCELGTASLARGHNAVCVFVDDDVGVDVVDALADHGVRLILLRCAGWDNMDCERAVERGVTVLRVPAYDPLSISEYAVAMMLSLNRHLCASRDRLRMGNFTLDGLVGSSLRGKTVGVLGTGKIGRGVADILKRGFQMNVLGFDKFPNKPGFCGEYMDLDEVLERSDVVSLHLPLTPETDGLIDKYAIAKMKRGAILINTSRGALVDARAAIDGLVSGKIAALGLDVYENENKLFFKDFSSMNMEQRMLVWDETMAILGSMPNVLVTPHTAFLTHEALHGIAATTAENFRLFKEGETLEGDHVVCVGAAE